MPVSSNFKTEVEKPFPDVPEGVYTVEIYDISEVEDVSYKTRFAPPEAQEKVTRLKFVFAILEDVKIDEESTTRGRRVFRTISPFVSFPKNGQGGSHLFFLLRGIYGNDAVPKGQLSGDELNELIGTQFQAIVRMETGKNGKNYPTFDFTATMKAKELLSSYLHDENNPANKKQAEMNEDVDPGELPPFEIEANSGDSTDGEPAIDKLSKQVKGK